MQQKYLEEQIGAHRKSKKALSAKQRTAKKAGREFPEEDAEQLKHVTEQQSMVQRQLEQVRRAGGWLAVRKHKVAERLNASSRAHERPQVTRQLWASH